MYTYINILAHADTDTDTFIDTSVMKGTNNNKEATWK